MSVALAQMPEMASLTAVEALPPMSVDDGLGAYLLSGGHISQADLERAERLAADHGETLAAMVSKLGLSKEDIIASGFAAVMAAPLMGPEDLPVTALDIKSLSPLFLKEHLILPIKLVDNRCMLAMANPVDAYAVSAFQLATGTKPIIAVAEPSLIEKAIDRLYADQLQPAANADTFFDGERDEDFEVERLKDMASEAPVVRLVNGLIARAVESRASDIHFEPFDKAFLVRFRIDGVLQEGEPIPERLRAAVISRIKIMARLDIAERRLPQDGRIKTVVRGKAIDLRVSTLQIMHGESVVMRILDREAVALDLDALGVQGDVRDVLDGILETPDGIFLVTGPTGSGKTTSLYAALCQINSPEKKIITVEDPIEYQIGGVNQVQVNPSIGLDFSNVLRSMLRQDPDIIMVGEIRDRETAEIATQAALTGHLVLSTLHTNDAASAITRLMDMGIEEYLLTSALVGVAAQRLVRKLCPDCKQAYEAPLELIEKFNLRRGQSNGPVLLYKPCGCEACNGKGYRGRTVVIEAIRITDALRTVILKRGEAHEVKSVAIAEGMVTMFEDGVAKALAGVTSFEEVLRTTREA
jgi:general secretion pathway protein E